mgnify:CR=1 FL=1
MSLPTNGTYYEVRGLGPGVTVFASLNGDANDKVYMNVNDVKALLGFYKLVRNGDKISINVCSSQQYGVLLTYSITVGEVTNTNITRIRNGMNSGDDGVSGGESLLV